MVVIVLFTVFSVEIVIKLIYKNNHFRCR